MIVSPAVEEKVLLPKLPPHDTTGSRTLTPPFGPAMPPLLSLKPALGHTLGASGIAELAALLACLEAGQVPATAQFAEPDAEIGLAPTAHRQAADVRCTLLNLIGFGGGLASLIVARDR